MGSVTDETLSSALSELVSNELVNREALDEVLTKCLFLRAFDKAAGPLLETEMPSVTLESLVEALQLDTHEGGGYRSRDANGGDVTLEQYFGARLSLAQWLGCEDGSFGPAAAEEALLSHSALVAPVNCPDVDLMMVLALDERQAVDVSNLLVIFIQTKNLQHQAKVDITDETLEPYRKLGVPVIFIVHEVYPVQPWSCSARQKISVSCS